MTRPEPPAIAAHRDPALFREAVAYTAARTGFAPRLIEKDYFCTVVLAYLARGEAGLVLKGGTALAKVHAGFYRLSEDLDFAIPMPVDASRRERSRAAQGLKAAIDNLEAALADFTVHEALRGSNNSAQYHAVIRYDSPTTGQSESIRIEAGLREPLLLPPINGQARTMLLSPITDQPLVPELSLPCIARAEALAEELRAALTRREVAIRDFYDLHHAAAHLGLSADDPDLIALVRRKLSVPGSPPSDVSTDRLNQLRRQREARLRAVLRPQDFEARPRSRRPDRTPGRREGGLRRAGPTASTAQVRAGWPAGRPPTGAPPGEICHHSAAPAACRCQTGGTGCRHSGL